jgi:hypothetical protein
MNSKSGCKRWKDKWQIEALEKAYKKNQNWSKNDVGNLAYVLNLSFS